MDKILDSSEAPRQHLIHFLRLLVRDGKIGPQDLNREVFSVVGMMQDMEPDIPHIYENVAEMVAPLIREKFMVFPEFEGRVRDALPQDGEALFIR